MAVRSGRSGISYSGYNSYSYYTPRSNSYRSSYDSTPDKRCSADEGQTNDGSECEYSWECKSGCCDRVQEKCISSTDIAGECQKDTTCGAEPIVVFLRIMVVLCICCGCPCICICAPWTFLVFALTALTAYIFGLPILLFMIHIGSGGLAAPITGSIFCVWACTVCCLLCLCHCCIKCVKNYCRDYQRNIQARIDYAQKRRRR